MNLNGKCLIDFEKWRLNIHQRWIDEKDEESVYYGYSQFNDLPQSMQYGVLVDFFDSVGIFVSSHRTGLDKSPTYTYYIVSSNQNILMSVISKTYQGAREQAILKANEIYNENYK